MAASEVDTEMADEARNSGASAGAGAAVGGEEAVEDASASQPDVTDERMDQD